MIEFELPYPPTVNTYWRNYKGKMIISERGRKYARDVAWLVRGKKFKGVKCGIFIRTFMPDSRERDLDNILKALLDSLVKAGVLVDDSIIDDLHVVRHNKVNGGKVLVYIWEIEQ